MMCTNIATKTRVAGSAKTSTGWTAVDEAVVGFDHATHLWREHAIRIDFTRAGRGSAAAIELDLESGRALLERLRQVVSAAEASGVED